MTVGGILPRRAPKPRVRKPKTIVRLIWSGRVYRRGDSLILEINRGAHKRETDENGAIVSDSFDSTRWCMGNIGSRFVVCGGEDANASVEVVRVEQGWPEKLTVRVLAGEVEHGKVHVMKAGGK